MTTIQAIPKGYHAVTPYLCVRGAAEVIEFARQAFGAFELTRLDRPDGTIMHAELRIADSNLMISEACEQMGPMPTGLYVYVDDVDASYQKALDAGATSVMGPMDMFWGDRFATVRDVAGNMWSIATHIEDVSPQDIAQRAQAFAQQSGQPA